MKFKAFILIACAVLVLGSLVAAASAQQQHAIETRGWVNAAETSDLPVRLPLAGVNVELRQYGADELNDQLDKIEQAGFTWVRQPFLWQDIEPEQGQFEWEAYDALVEAVAAHPRLQIVTVLDGTPAWARHELAPDHPYAPPASVSQYADFARAVAERYGGTITQYQIWDEPNITSHWGNLDVRPALYVAMLREAYGAIHGADEDAQVIAAALAPTVETGPRNLSDVLYLRAMYELDAGPYFDAAAGKPYGFDSGPDDRRVDEDVLNFSRLILLREQMVSHGDGTKPLWGSNFGWNALPEGWSGPPSIWGSATADQQLQYTRDAYARALREWPWARGLILQHWDPAAPDDDPVQGFAVAPQIDRWTEAGVPPDPQALIPGLHAVQNPYTTYSENWQFSDLGADATIPDPDAVTPETENTITLTFEGDSLAIPVHRDDYMAYLFVTVDGEPANALPHDRDGNAFLLLTSPERAPETDLVTVADGLPFGVHTATIIQRPYNGDDRWPIAGYAVGSSPDTHTYNVWLIVAGIVGGLALLVGLVTAARLPWRRVRPPAPETLRRSLEWLLGLFVSFVALVGLLLTLNDAVPSLLRRDPPALILTLITAGIASLSPWFVVTLAALVILFVLIFNRPVLGAMLVIFWSAFFLSKLDLLFRAFATVEVYLVITALAVVARLVVEWAKARQAGRVARILPRLTALDWLALAWLVLGAISLAWAAQRSPAVHYFRVIMLEPVVFYAVLRLMRLEHRDLFWLSDAMVFTGLAVAVVGLYLYVTGQSVVEAEQGTRRLIGVYGSPNGVGLYLGRCLPFAAAYAVLPTTLWRRAFGAGSTTIMLLAVLLSQSRGAILLGLPAAAAAMILLWQGRRALLPLAGLAVAAVIALVLLSLALPRLGDLTGDTAFFRTRLWFSSLNLVRENPITGAGLDQFLYQYRSRYLLAEAWQEPNLSVPHNILLNYWVNLGVVGVLAGIAFQAAFWRGIVRLRRYVTDPALLALVLGLAGSMADMLGHGLVDVGYFSINLAFVFFLLLALLPHARQYARPVDPADE
ncbi:O-antigen ligase family protein [Aggregatilinea lenta]|uniref:O-antigen ligase family protein n=1 Tax=Aggregatilinea lenta TaxID=913108 RepID=UPI000E5B3063|nr:O-antigen ligase family protein [Aggregatilinea lenta]